MNGKISFNRLRQIISEEIRALTESDDDIKKQKEENKLKGDIIEFKEAIINSFNKLPDKCKPSIEEHKKALLNALQTLSDNISSWVNEPEVKKIVFRSDKSGGTKK